MEALSLVVVGGCLIIIAVLLVKIHLLHKAAREISQGFAYRLDNDTNTLIDISCRDRQMRKLAASINLELRRLRTQRRRFLQGDTELKNAVTNISHDLRTPLTAICGYLDLLKREEKSENTERYLEVIENRVELMNQLTEELFRYSVILAGDGGLAKEQTDIGSVLEESIAAFYGVLCERGITPDIRMPEEKVIRMLDASALSRVFSNLLSNAVKYSDGDLKITLSEDATVVFSNHASGINQLQVARLFDRFYTVEAARTSTGLGLAIARTLLEQMGGTITAQYEQKTLSLCVRLQSKE